MPYDPNRHHRQSIRLRGYDYTQPGTYFVTICTHARQLLFDNPALRRIAEQQWQRIASERVTLNAWVVMPDHVHGIIVITSSNATPSDDASPVLGINVKPGSLGAIVRSYKASVTRRAHRFQATAELIWQGGYWERIMRSDDELAATRAYIAENPLRWAEEREDLDALLAPMEGKA